MPVSGSTDIAGRELPKSDKSSLSELPAIPVAAPGSIAREEEK